MARRKHWTQTIAGKKRLSARMKQFHAANGHNGKKKTPTKTNHASSPEEELDEAVFAYALGHIESWIGTYASSAGVPANALTSRLGKVLQSKGRG